MPPMPPRTGVGVRGSNRAVGGWLVVAGWGSSPAGNSAGHYHWLCSGVEGGRGTGSISQSLTFIVVRRFFFKSIKV
jgi:hypothetical protein